MNHIGHRTISPIILYTLMEPGQIRPRKRKNTDSQPRIQYEITPGSFRRGTL